MIKKYNNIEFCSLCSKNFNKSDTECLTNCPCCTHTISIITKKENYTLESMINNWINFQKIQNDKYKYFNIDDKN